MNKEFDFLKIINSTLSNNSYLGDDCAYLKEYNLAVSSDILVENVHFSLCYMSPFEIAQKAMISNISDVISSGAEIKYATIALSGKLNEEFIKDFYLGVEDISKTYGVKIIGGDLTKSDKITVSITVFGDYKNRNISHRKNAQEGYIIATKGEFGSSAKGLEELKQGKKDGYFIDIHKKPKLYPKTAEEIALKTKKPYAMMDSSDGLVDCLFQISQKSNVRIDVDYDKIHKKTSKKDYVLFGGEDYCLVVCLDENDFKQIKGLNKIGVCSKGSGVYIDNKKIEYGAFEHFE